MFSFQHDVTFSFFALVLLLSFTCTRLSVNVLLCQSLAFGRDLRADDFRFLTRDFLLKRQFTRKQGEQKQWKTYAILLL